MRRRLAPLALVLVLGAPAAARAFSFSEPAPVLVMPFDATQNRTSFALVSRMGVSFGGAPVETHWVFYAADCRHLADVFITLTDDDTVVVDPRHLQGQVQAQTPPENVPVGPVVDLGGERGVLFVSAVSPAGEPSHQLVGAWTIADLATGTGFGNDAIGLGAALPDPELLDGGVMIQTFDPASLGRSEVILLGVEGESGRYGPITRPLASGGGAVCCDTSFTDTLELAVSLPAFCFACAGFATVSGDVPPAVDPALVPAGTVAGSAGFVRLDGCRSAAADGSAEPVGTGDVPQFIFGFHGQAVGTFGVAVSAKYRLELLPN